ncbi:hypothetical protein E2C01_063960 [Portunus trituberculatus]|uniref:Uncharacterized protein n=1 Tax=Portunus trituberculatus TaxID=210409 RepID=A0A5B7HJ24_PORTR|nr:hypothetical protein [Portunus trituberculatus]
MREVPAQVSWPEGGLTPISDVSGRDSDRGRANWDEEEEQQQELEVDLVED